MNIWGDANFQMAPTISNKLAPKEKEFEVPIYQIPNYPTFNFSTQACLPRQNGSMTWAEEK
jgi:hypothetical protein